ncbi:hypothetical protein PC129_g25086 [Phytophthora cactorum]|uniref:Uncharacterized protein n=1 Tax=Phytophthora cactorum TaxID=29920 RepID=A0A8T1B2N1_9STRA|nr:hypothetical protein Pcac1_g9362 [Phytophthora cactorum]KAG2804046.1 hypothetical protein PC112_g18898 [Phytophthora cactorum]KAG2804891.1 hypothetical protein PC111_g18061 [Phytophthora cactorum]KAG2842273.1 hypothetical protein PC113_g18846 [Phytophthora cactorum]KAG2883155.1 hypothetical protein PC114_g20705 [Phytophthora cactorum]
MLANSSGGQQPGRGQTQAQQGTGQQQQNQQQPAMAGVAGGGAFPRRMFGSKPPKYTEDGCNGVTRAGGYTRCVCHTMGTPYPES